MKQKDNDMYKSIFWDDVPAWGTILDDWVARVTAGGVDLSAILRDVRVIARDAASLSHLENNPGAWWPRSLDRVEQAPWDDSERLIHGVRGGRGTRATGTWLDRIPYQSAGMRDGIHAFAKMTDLGPRDIGTIMMAMTGMMLSCQGSRDYSERSGMAGMIGELAVAALDAAGFEMEHASTRKDWLPAHGVTSEEEEYADAIAAIVDEHVMVLQEWRPVRYVGSVETDGTIREVDAAAAQAAETEMMNRVFASSPFFQLRHPGRTGGEARIAPPPTEKELRTRQRHDAARRAIAQALSATGRNPDAYLGGENYAATPITMHVKTNGAKRVTISVHRSERFADEDGETTWIEVAAGIDGSMDDACRAAVAKLADRLDECDAWDRSERAAGRDPADVQPSTLAMHPLARRALEAFGVDPVRDIAYRRSHHSPRQIQAEGVTDDVRERLKRHCVEMEVTGRVVGFNRVVLPCPVHGGIAVEAKDGIVLQTPRRFEPAEGAEIAGELASPVFAGLTGCPVSDSGGWRNATWLKGEPVPLVT